MKNLAAARIEARQKSWPLKPLKPLKKLREATAVFFYFILQACRELI